MKWSLFALFAFFACIPASADPALASSQVPLIFSGGHDTDPRDGGRPVILVAAGLNVPPEVFRQAFRNVHPAPMGQPPQDADVRKNKAVLMAALGPYGVTNDRLDTVSNRYRYRRGAGEMWRIAPATGYATVQDGAVTGITITHPGYGYSSPPDVTVTGMANVNLTAKLLFTTDLEKNGSVKQVAIASAKP